MFLFGDVCKLVWDPVKHYLGMDHIASFTHHGKLSSLKAETLAKPLSGVK
jgi:hypothetical protein